MTLTDSELSDVIGVQNDEINKQDIIPEIKTPEKKVYPCEQCGEIFDTPVSKATHMRVHHPKGKTTPKTEEPKVKDLMPENIAFLKTSCLKPFGAQGLEHIAEGMMESPEDIDLLQQLLAANNNTKNIPYITKRYANYIGKTIPSTETGILSKPVSPIESAYQNRLMERLDNARVAQMEKDAFGNQNNKDTGEISKLTQMITDMQKQQSETQRQFNEKLVEMQRTYTESLEKQRVQNEMSSLKEELKKIKEESKNQIGALSGNMSEFATNITHLFEKKELKEEHEKKENELKKEISDIKNQKALTNEQYMFEKTTKMAEEAIKAAGGALDGFGKALQPATQRAAESSNTFERARLALDLKQQGFNEQTIASVLNQPPTRTSVPSARSEFEAMSRMTEQLEQKPPQPEPQPAEANTIKFNAGD